MKNLANIKPFMGYRYNSEKIDDIGTVVAPTQYNISDDEKSKLYEINEYNAVKIFDGKETENDTDTSNKYTRAAAYLNDWIEKDILVRDSKPAIYLYEQTLEFNGIKYQNMTYVALLELEEIGTGNVMSCEEIREMSRQDRYDLLSATNADMSLISCLYVERDKQLLNLMNDLSENEPDMIFDTVDGMRERLWKITDEAIIEKITEGFRDLPLYITDGQTRYETCVQYRNYMREKNPDHTGKEAYNYTMVSLINSNSDGVDVAPVHRKIKLPKGFSEQFFIAAVQDHFKIEKIIVDSQDDGIAQTMKKQIHTKRLETKLGVYQGGNYFYRLTLKNTEYIKNELLPEMSSYYCGLDTVVLRKLIINDIFGIEDDYEDLVSTSISATECCNSVNEGTADVAIVMNSVKVEQIEKVTAEGEKLPFRSISIFPKPQVGVVINIKED